MLAIELCRGRAIDERGDTSAGVKDRALEYRPQWTAQPGVDGHLEALLGTSNDAGGEARLDRLLGDPFRIAPLGLGICGGTGGQVGQRGMEQRGGGLPAARQASAGPP